MSSLRNRGPDRRDRIYRDPRNGLLAGVLAGVADYLGVSRQVVRLAVVLWVVFLPPNIIVALVAYLVLALILPRRPEGLYEDEGEERFWQSLRRSPQQTASDVRHRFRELDRRLQRMERYVTSRRYNLDREFRNL